MSELTLKTHEDMVLEVAKHALGGILQGPLFTAALIDAMKTGTRTNLGNIMVDEAWAMAETLVSRYEMKVAAPQETL